MSNTLGAQLRAARRASGMKLVTVRDRTGISISFLSDIERGRSNPSVQTLYKLAALYAVSVDSLLTAAVAAMPEDDDQSREDAIASLRAAGSLGGVELEIA